MFTGIIEEIGKIQEIKSMGPEQSRLVIGCKLVQGDMKLGDSLAVNGVCLTVVRFDETSVDLEVSPETIRQTLIGKMSRGTEVNLERALALGGRLGGHIVQGHVDATAQVKSIQREGEFYQIRFSLPESIKRYVVHKGSITIDGISLTVASRDAEGFAVAVIPHTYENTNLYLHRPGSGVHLESDVLARYIEALMIPEDRAEPKSKLDEAFLRSHGF